MKKTIIELRKYDNKSRKGIYLYIKKPGKNAGLYKYDENTPKVAFIKYYEDRGKGRKWGSLTSYKRKYQTKVMEKITGQKQKGRRTSVDRQAEQYVRRIKRSWPKVEQALKTGITTAKIRNIKGYRNTLIKAAKRDLLKDRVLDDDILNMMMKPENFKKIAWRTEYRIEVKDKSGNTIMKTEKFGETPEKVMEELTKAIKRGEYINKNEFSKTKDVLEKMYGYQNTTLVNQGMAWITEVTIIMRKAGK